MKGLGGCWKLIGVVLCCSCRSQREKVEDKARNFGAFWYSIKEFRGIFLPGSYVGSGHKNNSLSWEKKKKIPVCGLTMVFKQKPMIQEKEPEGGQ